MSLIDLTPIITDVRDTDAHNGPVFPLHGIRLFIDLEDVNGLPVNDALLTLGVQDEGHGQVVIDNATLLNPTTGRYEYVHCAQASGKTNGHWLSTGTTKISLHFFYRVCYTQIRDHLLLTVPSGAIGASEGGAQPVVV